METRRARAIASALMIVGVASVTLFGQAQDQPPGARVPWTTSTIHGSPEPPRPYRLERVFPALSFNKLTHMTAAPGTKRLFVTTEFGQIISFDPDAAAPKKDPFLDLPNDVKSCQPNDKVASFDTFYSVAFHPKYPEKRFIYVVYVLNGKQPINPKRPQQKSIERVARFTVDKSDSPRADPASETILLEFPAQKSGHNGSTLVFGPDGMLYISIGDGASPTPADPYATGQDISDLHSSVLRIDVDQVEGDKPYKIPADNPFVKFPGARPEVWAFGFRNPWKMSFDRLTGELWLGDVGWEMWEMVYRVRRGGNYGWSIMEGPQVVHGDLKPGPTPILPPNKYFPHSESASITGGYVYRGKRFPDLVGTYLYGDYVTGRVWSTRFDGDKVVDHKEIANSHVKIVAFGEDHDGEIYVLNHANNDGIYQLTPNTSIASAQPFPRKLSETGLFASVAPLKPAPGVVPYSINAEAWMDHGSAERVVALPNLSTVNINQNPKAKTFFPEDGVLAKTISMEMERGNAASKRRLETQILHFDGAEWNGYTYRWNEAQTDADLVPSAGAAMDLEVRDATAPGGQRKQTWQFSSRSQCLVCHNLWMGPPLGFKPDQLTRAGQVQALQNINVLAKGAAKAKGAGDGKAGTLTDPYDAKLDLSQRARSYLDVNCAHCHVFGAGGTALIDLSAKAPLTGTGRMKGFDSAPVQGTFNIADARLVAPGDPFHSVLYYRISKNGPGRMPHIGSEVVDTAGVDLIHDWIRSMAKKAETPAAEKSEKADLDAVIGTKSADVAADPALKRLLSSTSGAMMLARALEKKLVPASQNDAIVAVAVASQESEIRDLFERFLPASKRLKRLGPNIQPEIILAKTGNPEQGRIVFFKTAGVQCALCHKVGTEGGAVGPDLSGIGKKYDRAKILENILDPSKDIDPAFVSYAVQLNDGRLAIGLIVSRNEKEIVLRDAQAKEHRFAVGDVDSVTAQKKSLMPDQLMRDLTIQQAVDLLEFLAGQKQ